MICTRSTLQKVSMSGADYLHVLERDIPLSSIPKVIHHLTVLLSPYLIFLFSSRCVQLSSSCMPPFFLSSSLFLYDSLSNSLPFFLSLSLILSLTLTLFISLFLCPSLSLSLYLSLSLSLSLFVPFLFFFYPTHAHFHTNIHF